MDNGDGCGQRISPFAHGIRRTVAAWCHPRAEPVATSGETREPARVSRKNVESFIADGGQDLLAYGAQTQAAVLQCRRRTLAGRTCGRICLRR
jgi:hypothetical protein